MRFADAYSQLLPKEHRYATALDAEKKDSKTLSTDEEQRLEGLARARALARELLLVGEEEQDLLLHYLRVLIDEGLPKVQEEEDRKDVLIVGAGITGLVAGWLLSEAGHEVKIIEANADRIGGRIKTFHKDAYVDGKRSAPFRDPKQYAEAGAMRLPSFHPLVLALIDKLGLKRRYFYNVSIEEGTGEPDRIPPAMYRAFDEESTLWSNRAPQSSNPPKHENRTWIRTNEIQMRKNEYSSDFPSKVKQLNSGFEMTGSRRALTASKILDHVLEPIRKRFEVAGNKLIKTDDFGNSYIPRENLDAVIEAWTSIIYEFDRYSMFNLLKTFACEGEGLDDHEIEAVGTLENLTSRLSLSFIHSFLGRADINPNVTYFEIEGGMWRLPHELYERLKDKIILDRRMTHLEYYDSARADQKKHTHPRKGQRVSIRCVSERPGDEAETFQADVCLVTIPFSSLRHVSVNPMFSYKKRRAIIELHYDAATKVLLEFSERWWEFASEQQWQEKLAELKLRIGTEEYSRREAIWSPRAGSPPGSKEKGFIGGGSVTDNPNRFIYYPSHPVKGSSGGVILASYSWSDDARRWDSMHEEERFDYALSNLIKLHDWRAAMFYTGHGQTQSWMQNPYAFGEAAVFTPGQMTSFHLDIPKREGPVFFAGEHVSLKHAWIEGCLETATRAAEDIHCFKIED